MTYAGQAARESSRRAWAKPSTILITGATGGIGAALARSYAQPGRRLILHGRDTARLAALTQECEARGAQVHGVTFDLRDAAAAIKALRDVSNQYAIDLAIVNAGVSRAIGNGLEAESWDTARTVLTVNLDGAIATVAGVLPDMRRRGAGQIAIVSSLAAYFGLPITPIYCASKAALKSYGEALRGWLAPQGIAVNVVMPGFVRTPMTEQFPGARPMMMSPERAATLIRRGLARNRARIAFPRMLAFGMWCLSALPAALSQWMVRMAGFSR
ncbi:MAG TPA: SDR family NAD(P)-dependent oxidoreductase [Steroidobacteraceae bacterium]|jgi:short-subunit dehydrogenase|nr:SDR family NAD(P)-dependent oxidoreductase [Steroidobacteraceae bacterium]